MKKEIVDTQKINMLKKESSTGNKGFTDKPNKGNEMWKIFKKKFTESFKYCYMFGYIPKCLNNGVN